jgi:hypothetical protein
MKKSMKVFTVAKFAMVLLLAVLSSGCLATPPRDVDPPSGMVYDPTNRDKGWVQCGTQRVHFMKINGDWIMVHTEESKTEQVVQQSTQPALQSRPTQSHGSDLVIDSPDRYEPLIGFLRRNNLRASDIETIAHAYNMMGIRAQQGENSQAFLQQFNRQLKSLDVDMTNAVGMAEIIRQVNSRIE